MLERLKGRRFLVIGRVGMDLTPTPPGTRLLAGMPAVVRVLYRWHLLPRLAHRPSACRFHRLGSPCATRRRKCAVSVRWDVGRLLSRLLGALWHKCSSACSALGHEGRPAATLPR